MISHLSTNTVCLKIGYKYFLLPRYFCIVLAGKVQFQRHLKSKLKYLQVYVFKVTIS